MPSTVPTTRAQAEALDRDDPLAPCRSRFDLPAGVRYFDGNSLGPLPHGVASATAACVAEQWGTGLVRSWNEPWIDLPARAAAKIARLIGVAPDAVAVTDSVSVNLFKLLDAALRLRPERRHLVVDGGDFPTDVYVAEGLCDRSDLGMTLHRLATGEDVLTFLRGPVAAEAAVVCLSHASYRDGSVLDLKAITAAAHDAGALVVWDLSHSAGALDLDLTAADVDFAVGCGYKYLNGGPGAPAFLYVAPRWQDAVGTPIQGWLGHDDFFAFEGRYRPAPGVARFHCGTWPILSLTALDAALDAFEGVAMADLRTKSLALGDLLMSRLTPWAVDHGLTIVTPTAPEQRGSMVAVRHAHGYAVMQALIARGVIGDFRPPDIMRFGLTPLYLRYVDVWDAIDILRDVLDSRAWDDPRYHQRGSIT